MHWPQTFHLCNTLSHPSSIPLGCPPQFTQGKARPTTVLLLPYRKQDLPISRIPRHHESTLCISPTSPMFFFQLSFCGVPLTMFQWCYGCFLLQSWCSTQQACWLLAFWHDATLPTCPVPSHHIRTVQTHAGCVWIPKVAHIQGHLIFKLIILRYWLIHFIILHFFTCNSYFLNFL